MRSDGAGLPGRLPVVPGAPGSPGGAGASGGPPQAPQGLGARFGGGVAAGPLHAADELRPLPGAADAARRRDEAAVRRGATAHRLMGAVAKRLADEAEEERAAEDVSGGAGTAGAAADGSALEAAGRDSSVLKAGPSAGRPRRTGGPGQGPVQRAAAWQGRRGGSGPPGDSPLAGGGEPAVDAAAGPAGPCGAGRASVAGGKGGLGAAPDEVWEAPVDPAGDPARVQAPEGRIEATRRVPRQGPLRPVAPERVGRSPRMRPLSWGALLAAVAALVVLIVIGGFEAPASSSSSSSSTSSSGGDSSQEPERAGRR